MSVNFWHQRFTTKTPQFALKMHWGKSTSFSSLVMGIVSFFIFDHIKLIELIWSKQHDPLFTVATKSCNKNWLTMVVALKWHALLTAIALLCCSWYCCCGNWCTKQHWRGVQMFWVKWIVNSQKNHANPKPI